MIITAIMIMTAAEDQLASTFTTLSHLEFRVESAVIERK